MFEIRHGVEPYVFLFIYMWLAYVQHTNIMYMLGRECLEEVEHSVVISNL